MKKSTLTTLITILIFSFRTYAQWSIPGTAGTAQWAKIGTFTAAQGGQTLRVTAFIHQGYNASNSQDAVYTITFKTSNGVSVDPNGFAGNSSWFATGENNDIPPGNIKWKANAGGVSATSYDLYIYLPQYTENCHYNVDLNDNGTWTNIGALSQTDPGNASSTVLIPTSEFVLPQGNASLGVSLMPAKLNILSNNSSSPDLLFTYNNAADYRNSISNNYDGGNAAGNGMTFSVSDGTTTGQTSVMKLLGNGNVGIGTASPVTALQVEGGASQGVIIGTAGGGGYPSWLGTNGLFVDGSARAASYVVGGGNTVQWGYGLSAIRGDDNGTTNSYLSFITGRTASSGERMRIIDNGYVGIGTTSPDQMLTVNGTIHATEVLVDLNVPAPDYVFEKNYKLRPLSEVRRYVSLNKHLPEIPSAKSMEDTGVNVSDMNMRLLKKVEELTLYLLDKDQQLTDAQRQLKGQKDINQTTQLQLRQIQAQLNKLVNKQRSTKK